MQVAFVIPLDKVEGIPASESWKKVGEVENLSPKLPEIPKMKKINKGMYLKSLILSTGLTIELTEVLNICKNKLLHNLKIVLFNINQPFLQSSIRNRVVRQ
jgi:hypothetical protein